MFFVCIIKTPFIDYSEQLVRISSIGAHDNGTFKVVVRAEDSRGVETVYVPVWSINNPNALKWYEAVRQNDGTYVANVSIQNHQYNLGEYTYHVYVTTKNKQKYSSAGNNTQIELKQSIGGSTQSVNQNDGTFQVVINASDTRGISEVRVPIWSQNNPSDIYWYTAQKLSENTFVVNVDVKNHKYHRNDLYNIHVYATINGTTDQLVTAVKSVYMNEVATRLSGRIVNSNQNEGNFEVEVDAYSSSGIDRVMVPVWNKNNPNNIKWYKAELRANGKYVVKVDIKNHNFEEGTFIIHAYVYPNQSNAVRSINIGENYLNLPSYVRLNVPNIFQLPELPTGCEVTAVTMMLSYKTGRILSKTTMANEMPRHSSDPNQGFVGNPFTTGGYTVYPPAFAGLVGRYAGSFNNLTVQGLGSVEYNLRMGKPVVAWMSVMHGFSVHAILITGFDSTKIYYNDPWTGQKEVSMTKSRFMVLWNNQNRRALSY